jgi:hypothetical protein
VSNAFLVAAVVLNAGFALAVFWWVLREWRRTRPGKPSRADRGAAGRPDA